MYAYSRRSREFLSTCHIDLQRLFVEVLEHYDHSVLCGHRNEVEQNAAFKNKRSKLKWPESHHNTTPSIAVDVAPYPIDWDDYKRFYHFAGFVLATAEQLDINVRWGGDWNKNNVFSDQDFNDLVHWELVL